MLYLYMSFWICLSLNFRWIHNRTRSQKRNARFWAVTCTRQNSRATLAAPTEFWRSDYVVLSILVAFTSISGLSLYIHLLQCHLAVVVYSVFLGLLIEYITLIIPSHPLGCCIGVTGGCTSRLNQPAPNPLFTVPVAFLSLPFTTMSTY